jgi:tRNA(Ile)-lysidine synthase TilS/MesJ
MDCFRCSWNRRKTLFLSADELGCTTIAYGHHADDAAVTTLLSLMYKGQLETLAPRLSFFDGRFSVIRPLILLSEAEIRRYARICGWTFPSELACPREDEARRAKVEAFLAQLPQRERKQIRANLWRAARAADTEEGTGR